MYWEEVVGKVIGSAKKFAFAIDTVFGRNFEIELHEGSRTGVAFRGLRLLCVWGAGEFALGLPGKISKCNGEAYRAKKVVKKRCVMLLAWKLLAQIIINHIATLLNRFSAEVNSPRSWRLRSITLVPRRLSLRS